LVELIYMDNCIFCKIVKGEIDSVKIWEDNDFMAILDVNPNTKGMTLILTKNHYDSYAFDMPDNIYSKFLLASKKVGKLLEKGLNVKRVAMVMEGTGVNHAHIKLYPLYGNEQENKETIFFDKYPGYLSTKLGPAANINKLKELAQKIKYD